MNSQADAVHWLAARLSDSPAALRERALGYVETAAGGDVATRLAEAAVVALRAALEHGDDRAGAYDLLAADALLTHAVEAALEYGETAAGALLEAYGADALEARLVAGAGE